MDGIEQTLTVLDDGMRLGIEHLLADESLACMNVTADLAGQAAVLLRADEHHQPLAGRVARMLEDSVLGELCLLNLGKCLAAAFILEEIADTALPEATRAGELAATLLAHHRAES